MKFLKNDKDIYVYLNSLTIVMSNQHLNIKVNWVKGHQEHYKILSGP